MYTNTPYYTLHFTHSTFYFCIFSPAFEPCCSIRCNPSLEESLCKFDRFVKEYKRYKMDSADEVAPTEEVVKALLDYLVDPMLPLKASGKDPPLATREAVAKQMHAVVLLYNYYHREQNQELEFLEFEAFCKLAVSIKPALIAHMKLMQQTDLTGSDDMESQFSVTEKAIKDACKISSTLIALEDVSCTDGWPVSKVSVLLVDSKKENCLLLFSSITNGAWSVIEKCLDISNLHPEIPSEGEDTNKRKQKQKGGKGLTDEQSTEELAFRQVAFSAVEEETGINQSGLLVLERHVVYSLNEDNMAAYFYIMQCTQSSHEDIQIPIKDVIESLQGPLLKRSSNSWTLTPKIEYYNVLPYARIMSGWLSREGVSICSQTLNFSSSQRIGVASEKEAAENEKANLNDLHNFGVELGNVNVSSSERPEKPSDWEAPENRGSINGICTDANSYGKEATGADNSNKTEKEVDDEEKPDTCSDITNSSVENLSNADAGASKMTSADELQMSPNFSSKRRKKDIDGFGIACPMSEGKIKNSSVPIKVYHHQKRKISVESVGGASVRITKCSMETSDAIKSNGNELIDGKVAVNCIQGPISSPLNGVPAADCAIVPFEPNAKDVEKLRTVLATKEAAITDTALRALFWKREEWCHQQRVVEDKIASCSRDIQKIINGNEDALALKLDAILDCCNDVCRKGKIQIQWESHQQSEEFQRTTQCSRRNGLSDAILTLQTPCQELDYICHVNNWRSPRYFVSASIGGFVANVTMKEMDFDFSCEGALLSTPHAARDSAAALMIAKLRAVAGQTEKMSDPN